MATSQELQNYYADLLILQYKTQPKARATIKALIQELYGSGSPLQIVNGFDIETATGKQLDILGKYIGLGRQVKVNIGSSNTNILSDDQYRILLKLKLIQNTNFSSTSQIRTALYELFPNDIRLFDPRTMKYEYQLSTLFNDLVNVIIAEELLPLPMGIGATINVVPDLLSIYGYYGYDGLNNNENGYSSYTDGFRGKYLSYGDRT